MRKLHIMLFVMISFMLTAPAGAAMTGRDGNGIFQEQIMAADPSNKGWLTTAETRIILKGNSSRKGSVMNTDREAMSQSDIKPGTWVAMEGYRDYIVQDRLMEIVTNKIYVLPRKYTDAELKALFGVK